MFEYDDYEPVAVFKVPHHLCTGHDLELLKIIAFYTDTISWRSDDPGYTNRIPPGAEVTICEVCFVTYGKERYQKFIRDSAASGIFYDVDDADDMEGYS